MAVLRFEPSADDALRALGEDGPPELWERVNDVLDDIEDDPGGRASRRQLYRRQAGQVRGVPVYGGGYDWLILWHDDGKGPIVVYIGPALP